MKRIKNLFKKEDISKEDISKESILDRLNKTLFYDHGNCTKHIPFGKWSFKEDRPNGIYEGKFNYGLSITVRFSCYVVVGVHKKNDKLGEYFYLDTFDEAIYLIRGILYGVLC